MTYTIREVRALLNSLDLVKVTDAQTSWRLGDNAVDAERIQQALDALGQEALSGTPKDVWRLVFGVTQETDLNRAWLIELTGWQSPPFPLQTPLDWSRCFRQIKVTVILEEGSASATVSAAVLRVFPQTQLRLQKLRADANRSILLFEYLQQFLQYGRWPHEQPQLDRIALQRSHQALLITACCQRWQRQAITLPATYAQLEIQIQRLASYAQLAVYRRSKNLAAASLTLLASIEAQDQQVKCTLYAQTSQRSLSQALGYLPIVWLAAWQLETTLDSLLAVVQREGEQQYTALCRWEQQLAGRKALLLSDWYTYGRWQGQRLWNWFYASSFIGLGAELAVVLNQLATPNALAARSKTTHVRWAGGLLGAAYSYSLGMVSCIKLLFSSYLAQSGQQWAQAAYVDDRQARLQPMLKPLIQPAVWYRLMQLVVASLEAYYQGDTRALTTAVSGLISSQTLWAGAQRLFPTLRATSPQTLTETQWLSSVFTTLLGWEIGRQASDIGYTAYAQYQQCEAAALAFETQVQATSSDIVAAKATCRPYHWLPTFWSTPAPLQLTWVNREGKVADTTCTLSPLQSPISTATCDAPTVTSQRRL